MGAGPGSDKSKPAAHAGAAAGTKPAQTPYLHPESLSPKPAALQKKPDFMPAFSPTESAINDALRQRLAEAHCRRGRLDVSGNGGPMSLSGQRQDGKNLFFWDFSRAFKVLVADYLTERFSNGLAQLTIVVDLPSGTFTYSQLSTGQQKAAEQAAERQRIAHRRAAPRDTTPYGAALAGQVAAALRNGRSLGHSHRDYCGMGLDHRDGQFRYGSLWDGFLEPKRTFADEAAFVQWLAAQSDYTLAGLESKDPWAWDNQTVTRRRLELLVSGQPDF